MIHPLGMNEVKIICDNCVKLEELVIKLGGSSEDREALSYFCKNLTPEIRKLNIYSRIYSHARERLSEELNFNQIQFEKLTKRCNELNVLSIIGFTTTINGMCNIMKNLSQTLEKVRFDLVAHAWHSDEQAYRPLSILDLQKFEFQPMPKLTEVCFYQTKDDDDDSDDDDRPPNPDPSLIPQIQQVFHRKLPFVNTVFSPIFPDYDGIAVPDIEK